MASPPPGSHSPPERAMMAHLRNQHAFQQMRHATASPPVQNGVPFHHPVPSPQPPGVSRPPSRAHSRRPSSNLAPQQHLQVSHPAPPPHSYAYMPNPPIYNPNIAAGMPVRGQPGQPHPPQFQYNHPPSHPPPHPHMQQVLAQEQRRRSVPPAFPQQERPQSQPQQQPRVIVPSPPQPDQNTFHSPPLPQSKALPAAAKSHSIFTPIDDSRSLLAQHWGPTTSAEAPRTEPAIKMESGFRSQSIDVASMSRSQVNGKSPRPPRPQPTPQAVMQPQRTPTPAVPNIVPPSRTNSLQTDAKRPRLKVQIPSENSDGGEGTAESSSKDTAATAAGVASPRGPNASHSSVVLPPPSPSASALLSAGATGPPNPFARPAVPVNNNSYASQETPISALPSRFVSDQLLPSPSSFYPEWDFGGRINALPSPINFTPAVQHGPSFRDEDVERKRKASDEAEAGISKKVKA